MKPGVSTYDLDRLAKSLMESMGARSACYQYRSRNLVFPSHTCISINEEVVHGIAKFQKVVREGDNITLDVAVKYEGFIGDNARTLLVGEVSDEKELLNRVASEALELGIAKALPGNRVGDISSAIQKHVEKAGFGVVREFVGHGIGRTMHEEPQIPNFGRRNHGPILKTGMVLAIEPMVTAGTHRIQIQSDGWTAVTADRRPASHFELSVLVTDDGPEVLTVPKESASS